MHSLDPTVLYYAYSPSSAQSTVPSMSMSLAAFSFNSWLPSHTTTNLDSGSLYKNQSISPFLPRYHYQHYFTRVQCSLKPQNSSQSSKSKSDSTSSSSSTYLESRPRPAKRAPRRYGKNIDEAPQVEEEEDQANKRQDEDEQEENEEEYDEANIPSLSDLDENISENETESEHASSDDGDEEAAPRKTPATALDAAIEQAKIDGTRCGYVSLIGPSNTGKSTLINYLVGHKVAIVTPRVQTTRNRILGITIHQDKTQIIFQDTPGIFNPKTRLDTAMVKAAWSAGTDSDLIVLVMDLSEFYHHKMTPSPTMLSIIDRLAERRQKNPDSDTEIVLVMNKLDTIPKNVIPEIQHEMLTKYSKGIFSKVFPISAKKGKGVFEMKSYIASKMPISPWLFEGDDITNMPLRLMVAEITREKIFLLLRQEIPYSITVQTDKWQDRKDGSVRIEQTIFVRKDSQKGIVMGAQGKQIKEIGSSARQEMIKFLERNVHLFLTVKLSKSWNENKNYYQEWGLEYGKDKK